MSSCCFCESGPLFIEAMLVLGNDNKNIDTFPRPPSPSSLDLHWASKKWRKSLLYWQSCLACAIFLSMPMHLHLLRTLKDMLPSMAAAMPQELWVWNSNLSTFFFFFFSINPELCPHRAKYPFHTGRVKLEILPECGPRGSNKVIMTYHPSQPLGVLFIIFEGWVWMNNLCGCRRSLWVRELVFYRVWD